MIFIKSIFKSIYAVILYYGSWKFVPWINNSNCEYFPKSVLNLFPFSLNLCPLVLSILKTSSISPLKRQGSSIIWFRLLITLHTIYFSTLGLIWLLFFVLSLPFIRLWWDFHVSSLIRNECNLPFDGVYDYISDSIEYQMPSSNCSSSLMLSYCSTW